MVTKFATTFRDRPIELIEVSRRSYADNWEYYIADNHKEGTWEYETYGKYDKAVQVRPIGHPFILTYDNEKYFYLQKLEQIGKSLDKIFLQTIIEDELFKNKEDPIHLGILHGYIQNVSFNLPMTIMPPEKFSRSCLLVPYQFLTFE
ncbi:MAG: hypothetical protein WC867_02945 [Candidatus Pacearchaeota archaeon]|jgi:hypothetical protein